MRELPTPADVIDAATRVAGVALRTPVLTHPALDAAAGAEVFVKAECLQVTGSFKIRGAMNRLAQLSPAERKAGVVAFSSGNHAQGVSRAAKLLNMPALIVMPSDAPTVKIEGVRADGAEIHLYDRETESREAIAAEIAQARGAALVPSFDDPQIIAGQGTIGLELAEQAPGLKHVICCAGGGGLITGLALGLKAAGETTNVWSAEPEGHDDWARSLAVGAVQANAPGTRSICDAILTPQPGEITWALGKDLLSGGLVVSEDEVRNAMRFAARHLKLVAEPGGAAALACAVRGLPAHMQGSRVGLVITGGNVDPGMFAEIIGA